VSGLLSKVALYRTLLLAALVTQLAVVLIGTLVLYSCTRDSPYIVHHFWNALYWSIVGPAGLMFIGAQVTVPVVAALLMLVFSGLRWRRVRFLWAIGIFLWGAWWLFWVYVMCGAQAD
jgi:hypothetical protein